MLTHALHSWSCFHIILFYYLWMLTFLYSNLVFNLHVDFSSLCLFQHINDCLLNALVLLNLYLCINSLYFFLLFFFIISTCWCCVLQKKLSDCTWRFISDEHIILIQLLERNRFFFFDAFKRDTPLFLQLQHWSSNYRFKTLFILLFVVQNCINVLVLHLLFIGGTYLKGY